jgi:UDP:flavonoid glycosyltransferase YjiC (YdhE family)
VRLLFAFAGGRGHAEPLVPIARAAAARGHEVAFAGRRAVVEQLGFASFAVGQNPVPRRSPLVAFDIEREERVLREAFAGRLARAQAADVLALCSSYRPDAVVCDEVDFGSMVAAERLGVPCVPVLVTAAGFIRPELIAEPLATLRAAHGLAPEPPAPALRLSPFPPSLRDPGDAVCIRLGDAPRADGPTVYVTLGTVFPPESGDLLERILAGLGEWETFVTDGYVPQSEILPGCAAVVCHAGSGTVLGALAHGVPLVNVPIGADQPFNAARCESLGAGITLDPLTATPEEVGDAVSTVLTDPAYRAAAERIRDEIAAQPGADHAAELLEA